MEPQTIQSTKAILRKNKAGGETLSAFETQLSIQYGTASSCNADPGTKLNTQK